MPLFRRRRPRTKGQTTPLDRAQRALMKARASGDPAKIRAAKDDLLRLKGRDTSAARRTRLYPPQPDAPSKKPLGQGFAARGAAAADAKATASK